jgi:hypothetical protein
MVSSGTCIGYAILIPFQVLRGGERKFDTPPDIRRRIHHQHEGVHGMLNDVSCASYALTSERS